MARGIHGEVHDSERSRVNVRGTWRIHKSTRLAAVYWYDHPSSFFTFRADALAQRESSRDLCGFSLTVYAKPEILLSDGTGATQQLWCRVEPPDDFFDNGHHDIDTLKPIFQRKIVEEARRFLKRQAAVL